MILIRERQVLASENLLLTRRFLRPTRQCLSSRFSERVDAAIGSGEPAVDIPQQNLCSIGDRYSEITSTLRSIR